MAIAFAFDLFAGVSPAVIPILIFCARVVDVSLGTLRIMLVARGARTASAVLGFFEVLLWLLAISAIMQNLTNWQNYIAYCAGFATGTYIGMTIEKRLSLGTLMIRLIIPSSSEEIISRLIERGHKVTYVDGHGTTTPVKIVFSVVKRSKLKDIVHTIRDFDPGLFYTIENVRSVSHPVTPRVGAAWKLHLLQPFYWYRKGK